MPDVKGPDPPTFFANVVTMVMNVDELVLEFRRYLRSHKDLSLDTIKVLQPVPASSPQEVLVEEPIARVVLTFSAAKALMQYLDQALPQFEAQRRAQ